MATEAAAAAAAAKVSLKLWIDTKRQRVLFAEAGKSAVDFLFHILTLSMGSVIRLLTKQQMVGCLANLYDSVENLSDTYIINSAASQTNPNKTKDILLKSRTPLGVTFSSSSSPLLSLLMQRNKGTLEKDCYRCNICTAASYYSDEAHAKCPRCHNLMSFKMNYVAPPATATFLQSGNYINVEVEGGFVKGVATYVVMDDLVVKPISAVALLDMLNAGGVGAIEEKEVEIGCDEALDLLKTSLTSKTVLTSVFLKNVGKLSI